MSTGRFGCASSALSLTGLLKQGRKTLLLSLGLAVVTHLSLTRAIDLREEQKATKPLTTKFVKRQPRLTKPLEMKKRPRPKPRQLRREMVSVEAKIDRQQASSTIKASEVAQSLARPNVDVLRSTTFSQPTLEPKVVARAIQSTKEVANQVDMSLEMVDIEALDTGRYHAMVIEDPNDKRGIRGYFHFYRAYSVSMRSGPHGALWQDDAGFSHGIKRLIRALNEWTMIRSDMAGSITFDDAQMLNTPWVFATSYYSFNITDSEARALGRYMMAGGFFFADAVSVGYPLDYSFRELYKSAFASQGKRLDQDWRFERLPDTHPIYHCFFDFNGAPMGYYIATNTKGCLEGITINDRLLGLMSNQYYIRAWSHFGPEGFKPATKGYEWVRELNNTRQLQLGVNTIIFALTQEGSITRRVMNTVGH